MEDTQCPGLSSTRVCMGACACTLMSCANVTHTAHTRAHTQSSRRDGREGKDGVLGDAMTNVILNCGETEKSLGLWLIAFVLYHS